MLPLTHQPTTIVMKHAPFFLLSFFVFSTSAFASAQDDFFAACLACDEAGVKKAIDAGANVNALNQYNQNGLASAFFCPDVTKLLLEKGCDPNGGDYPAVINASNNYSVEVLKLLLDAGADPNKPGIQDPGASLRALIDAEKAKGKKANQAMIDAWENVVKTMPKTEVNALQVTVQQTNCVPCLEMLIKAGANVKTAETDGNLIHRLATFSMTQEERKANFAKGAPNMAAFGLKVPDWYSDLPNDKNGTPAEMLQLLLDAGLDPNAKRADGVSAFMAVLQMHRLELAKAMMRKGADAVSECVAMVGKIKVKSYPICAAAEFADVELMQMILAQKPNINVSVETKALGVTMDSDYGGNVTWGGEGYTPLIISIMSERTDVAKLLLDAGASVMIGSSGIAILKSKSFSLHCLTEISNKTPIYWAVERDDMELIQKIAEKMEWKFNPDFTIRQHGPKGGVGAMVVQCADFKNKQSPSIYAFTVGNAKASSFLSAKGL